MLHVFIAMLVGAVLSPLNLHQEGLFAAAVFYMGREHAQAEYRSIVTYYGNRRANAPWWCGFEARVWNKKSVLDWALPAILAIAVWLAYYE